MDKLPYFNKKINLFLDRLDGGILLNTFEKTAKKEGWAKDEIDIVLEEAMSGDYDNLINVLVDYSY